MTITQAQAEDLDGVLAGADDAKKTLEGIVGKGETSEAETAIREAFVSALGTASRSRPASCSPA